MIILLLWVSLSGLIIYLWGRGYDRMSGKKMIRMAGTWHKSAAPENEEGLPRLPKSGKRSTKKIQFRPGNMVAAVAAGIITGWISGWPVMGLVFAAAVFATPLLNVKSTQRQKDMEACEAASKIALNIVSLLRGGATAHEAFLSSLKHPPVEMEEFMLDISAAAETDIKLGITRLGEKIGHYYGDMLALTLNYIITSDITGQAANTLEGVATAATDMAKAEKRVMLKQRGGYFSAKMSLWTVLLIMFGLAVGPGSSFYSAYSTLTGQILLLGICLIGVGGVFMVIRIAKGKKLLRIRLKSVTAVNATS